MVLQATALLSRVGCWAAHKQNHTARRLNCVCSATPSQEAQPRRAVLGGAALAAAGAAFSTSTGPALAEDARVGEVQHTDAEWRQILSPEAYRVLRQAATERRYSSPLVAEHRTGVFRCAGCGAALFSSDAKFESGTGWPSFTAALPGAVEKTIDYGIPFMPRVEVRCKRCQGHLGHVFDDGPAPTGLRYCMNGAALSFQPSSS